MQEIDGLSDYMRVVSGRRLRVKAGSDWEGFKWHDITLEDLKRYIGVEARNISSGCRSLGGIAGDWRNIDELAKEVEWVFIQLHGEDKYKRMMVMNNNVHI